MSASSDPRWPKAANKLSDQTIFRPSLVRAWHGYLMCVYQDSDSDTPLIWTRMYDPYYPTQQFLSPANQLGFTSDGSIAAVYKDLYAFFIFLSGNGQSPTGLVWCSAYQPPLNPTNNSIQLGGPLDPSTVAVVDAAGAEYGAAAAIFNGQIYVVYARTPANPAGYMLRFATAPITSSAEPYLQWASGSTIGTFATNAEASLAVFNEKLYCAFRNPSDSYIHVINLAASQGAVWSSPVAVYQAAGGTGLAVDPTGTFLLMVYQDESSQQLMSCQSSDGVTWSAEMTVGGQETQATPTITTTPIGSTFLIYESNSGSQPNLYWCASNSSTG